MIDYFALLSQARRPWLDLDSLKQKFLALSTQCHPDRVHCANEEEKVVAQKCYTELNAGYNCLRDHKQRLLHLLELERGAKPSELQNIPADLMNLFLQVREVCQQADAVLAQKKTVTSPLLKVNLFERAQEQTEKLTAVQKEINSRQEQLGNELKAIDARWDDLGKDGGENREATLQKLEEIYRLASYFNRWSGQLQEHIVQLSF